jgi:transporter family-2 protein
LPWWVYGSGVLGLVIVSALGLTVANLGLGAGMTLFTAASLILAALVEHLGWFGDGRSLDLTRVLGIALVIGGTWLVVRG